MPGKRQPTDVIKANGRKHLSSAEEEARRSAELHVPPPEEIEYPKGMPAGLKAEFRGYVEQLIALGIYSNLDKDTLWRYLEAHADWKKASAQVRKALTAKDVGLTAKWTKIQSQHFNAARACAGDLGLTVTSRCHLVIPKADQEDEADPLMDLLAFPGGAEKLG